MKSGRLYAVLMAVAALGCGMTRPVQPLGRGRATFGASLGGPMVEALGLTMPTPILTLSGAYGLRDEVEVTGSANLTGAAYGVAHVAPGIAWHPIVRTGGGVPTLTLAGAVPVLTDGAAVRLAPHATTTAAWTAGGHAFYAGADAALVIGSPTRVLAGPLAGTELRWGRVGLGAELKWLAPYYDVEPTAPSWVSPGGRGFLSVLLGVSYYP